MRRLAVALAPSMAIGLMLAPQWTTGTSAVLIRTVTLGLTAMPVFGLFERWPTRLPNWIGRWALQVIGVGIAMPLTTCRQQLHALRGAAIAGYAMALLIFPFIGETSLALWLLVKGVNVAKWEEASRAATISAA